MRSASTASVDRHETKIAVLATLRPATAVMANPRASLLKRQHDGTLSNVTHETACCACGIRFAENLQKANLRLHTVSATTTSAYLVNSTLQRMLPFGVCKFLQG